MRWLCGGGARALSLLAVSDQPKTPASQDVAGRVLPRTQCYAFLAQQLLKHPIMADQHVGPPNRGGMRKIVLREQGWIPGKQVPGPLIPPHQGHPQMYATRPLPAVPPNSISPAPRPNSTASSVYADEPSQGPTTVEFIAGAPPTDQTDNSDFCGALDEDALALVRPLSLLTRLTHEQDHQEKDVAAPQPRLQNLRQSLFINTDDDAISPILPSPSSGLYSHHLSSLIVSPLTPHTYIDMYRDTPTSTNGDTVAMNEGRWPTEAKKPSPVTPPLMSSSWDDMTAASSLKSLGFHPVTVPGPEAETQRKKATFRHSDPISPVLLQPLAYGEPAAGRRPRTSGKDARFRSQDDQRLRNTPLLLPYYEDASAEPLESPNTRWDKAYGPPSPLPIDSAISMSGSTPGRAPSRTLSPFPPLAGTPSAAAAAIKVPSRPRKDSKVSFAVSPPSGFSTRPRGSSRSTPPPHLVLKSPSASGGGPEYVKSPFPLPQTGSTWEYDDEDDEDDDGGEDGGKGGEGAGTDEDEAEAAKKTKRRSLRGRSSATLKPPRTEGGGPRGGLEKLVSRMAQPFVSEETKRERRVEQLKRGIQHPAADLSEPDEPRDESWI